MKIAACIIAKDEEKNLPRLLNSLRNKFDEIILVDTGSKDRTVEIAKAYGCKVVQHEWNGFADARNRAVKEVSADMDWIWHFDADFELEEEEYKKALVYLKALGEEVEGVMIGVKNLDKLGRVKGISSHLFIHRNFKHITWQGSVHEFPDVKRAVAIPVFVNHHGYADKKVLIEKAKRNYKLLQEELNEFKEKDDKKYLHRLFYLVQTLTILSYEDERLLKEAKEKGEEFILLAESREKELGFFYIYAFNYLLSVLQRLNEYELYEKYLKKVMEKEFKIPDFYLHAYRFFRYKKKDYEAAFKALENLVSIIDNVSDNPFYYGGSFASDRLEEIKNIFLNEDFKVFTDKKNRVLEIWKKKKSKYWGIFASLLLECKDKRKVLKKLVRKYNSDEFVVVFVLKEIEVCKFTDELSNLLSVCEVLPLKYLIKARFFEISGRLDEAIHYYKLYLEQRSDPVVAAYVSVLLRERYGVDIKNLFRIKKNEVTSDNL